MELNFFLLCLFIFLSFSTEALTGFGCIIIAVALGAHFYPISEILILVVPMNLLLSTYFVIRYFKLIDRQLILKIIFPIMGGGTLLGNYLIRYIEGDTLKTVFGISVIFFALREIYHYYSSQNQGSRKTGGHRLLWIFSSGIIHGIYGSGGPMLVYALSGKTLNKGAFRATLSSVWFLMSLLLTVVYIYNQQINENNFTSLATVFPIVVLGVIIGELLHHRINEEKFKLVVYFLLLVSGFFLLR